MWQNAPAAHKPAALNQFDWRGTAHDRRCIVFIGGTKHNDLPAPVTASRTGAVHGGMTVDITPNRLCFRFPHATLSTDAFARIGMAMRSEYLYLAKCQYFEKSYFVMLPSIHAEQP